MSKAKKALIITGFVIAVIATGAVSIFTAILSRKTPVAHEARGMDDAIKKLAVITDGSEFKTQLKYKLLENAESGLGVEVFGLADAKNADPNDYDLVVIIAPVYMEKLQLNAKNYVNKHKEYDNLFLIVTSEGDNGIDPGVDAVAMATTSQFTDTPEVPMLSVDETYEMIMEKLN